MLDALETWLEQGTRGCGFINAYAELSTQSDAATRVVRAEKEWIRQLYASLLAEEGVASAEPSAGSSPCSTREPSCSSRPAVLPRRSTTPGP